ncbi:putative sodium-coupled neutral amino acid transporter 8 [Coregonus clupeaformis]|uniref:putative sodium-coupled neutral amino acid transporter 8 n=1 Tax=Coregonus clupeaformis TaxID=59861 RepID=UPI001BE0A6A0|nr:putative sodium-coupled neutral amino acid transporter 8 [Coregonus clupeaformis]
MRRISSLAAMFSAIPTICFGFQCHKACITIYSSMQNKSLSHWVFISVVTIFFCLIIYSLTGVYGYLTFGKDVAADILMSYTGDDVLMIIARLLFGISIITIYPIILLLGRSVIQDPLLSFRWCFHVVTESYENRSHVGLTRAWITVTLIAMFIPDISKVISVIGGISAFSIFIFPGGVCLVFAMQSETVSLKTRVVLTTWGIITLICGAFIFGQSTTIAIMQLLTKI